MDEVTKSGYAPFLEELIKSVVELKPQTMGICGMLPDGRVFTAYFGDPDPSEIASMAHHLNCDAMLQIVVNNAPLIKQALEELEEESGETES